MLRPFLSPVVIFALVIFLLVAPVSAQEACWTVETLTSTPNDDLEAQWSPDGTQIAFVGHHDGSPDMYLLDVATRQIRQISNIQIAEFHPLWSPDGQYLAFLHRGSSYTTQVAVQLFTLATGKYQRISDTLDDYRAVSWSSDSRTLRFGARRQYLAYDVAHRELREVYGLPTAGEIRVSPSPHDRQVVLEITTRNPDTSGNHSVELLDIFTGQREHLLDLWLGWQLPSWSPDGNQFAFADGGYPDGKLYLYDLSTRQLQTVQKQIKGGIWSPRWSPDGRLAWVVGVLEQTEPQTIYHYYLFVSDDPNQPSRELVNLYPEIVDLAWSPTRDQLAFQTYAGIYIVDVPSGIFHEFVQGIGKIEKLVWSPDGNYIAAHIQGTPGSQGYYATVITDIRTGANFLYGPFPDVSHRGDIQWSPDSRHLLFSSGPWGNTDLVMLTACEEQP